MLNIVQLSTRNIKYLSLYFHCRKCKHTKENLWTGTLNSITSRISSTYNATNVSLLLFMNIFFIHIFKLVWDPSLFVLICFNIFDHTTLFMLCLFLWRIYQCWYIRLRFIYWHHQYKRYSHLENNVNLLVSTWSAMIWYDLENCVSLKI